jgi:hypothetical protein
MKNNKNININIFIAENIYGPFEEIVFMRKTPKMGVIPFSDQKTQSLGFMLEFFFPVTMHVTMYRYVRLCSAVLYTLVP